MPDPSAALRVGEIVLDVDAVRKVLPRLCPEILTDAEVTKLDIADLFAVAAEITNFLLSKNLRADSLPT